MKKIMLMLLPVSLIAFLSGCSPFEKEVDYQPIANDLNEKNMDRILNAVDGYAEINHRAFVITPLPEDKNKKDKAVFTGVYNTNNNNAFGTGTKVKSIDGNKANELSKEEESHSFSASYSDGKYTNRESNEEFDLIFMLDKLQGINDIVPTKFSYGLDSPPSIFYDLNEQEFNEIINDDFQIEYDNFKRATLLISLQEDRSEKKFYISKIGIGVEWEEKDSDGNLISLELYNNVDMTIGNLGAKEDYIQLENAK